MKGDSPDWLTHGMRHIWLPYAQMKHADPPLPVVATEGTRIHLADGRVLVDGIASWWTACHGYNHPHLRHALMEQAARLPHVMFGGLSHEPAMVLATRLAALLPGDLERVFFAESGSVAVEVAMKMAMQYWLNRGERGRSKILSFTGGYHGDTFATMAVCDPEEGMHALFTGLLPEHHVRPLPRDGESLAALEQFLDGHAHQIAAMLVEPLVQGAGGMLFHGGEVLRTLRALADRYGILLIFDEIFTGFGRTGTMFACQAADVVPDIITLSKALTGGTLPLSATVARAGVFDAFWSDDPMAALMHGPTYMGNALACAVANASLDLFEQYDWVDPQAPGGRIRALGSRAHGGAGAQRANPDGPGDAPPIRESHPRMAQVSAINGWLAEGLEPCRGLPGVVDIRTLGAIGVVQMDRIKDLRALKRLLVAEGAWIRPFRDILYLTPAFTATQEDVMMLTGAITRVLQRGQP